MEIERKFWVRKHSAFGYHKEVDITQSYINKQDDYYEIRLRKYFEENILKERFTKFYLDFKSPGDLTREEFGIKITEEQYETLLKNVKHTLVKSRCYMSDYGGGVFFDRFHGDLEGLMTLEVEGDQEHVESFKVPADWDAVEVTYDPRFKNRNIVMRKWKDDIENWGLRGMPGKLGNIHVVNQVDAE